MNLKNYIIFTKEEGKKVVFAGFNLSLQPYSVGYSQLDDFSDTGKQLYLEQKTKIHNSLEQYINLDGSLNAKKIEENWFTQISANIFLSHSHADEEMAINLAGFLYKNYGLQTFIDSCVWGHANNLLRKIDNKYCKTIKHTDGSYSYNYKYRNQSTSHVHMLLNGALAKMINSIECLIFLNTPNSIKAQDATNVSKTASPWIYSELLMATEFPHQDLRHYRTLQYEERPVYEFEELQVEYNVNADKLTNLYLSDLLKINKINNPQKPTAFLDQLYLNKGLIKLKNRK